MKKPQLALATLLSLAACRASPSPTLNAVSSTTAPQPVHRNSATVRLALNGLGTGNAYCPGLVLGQSSENLNSFSHEVPSLTCGAAAHTGQLWRC